MRHADVESLGVNLGGGDITNLNLRPLCKSYLGIPWLYYKCMIEMD